MTSPKEPYMKEARAFVKKYVFGGSLPLGYAESPIENALAERLQSAHQKGREQGEREGYLEACAHMVDMGMDKITRQVLALKAPKKETKRES